MCLTYAFLMALNSSKSCIVQTNNLYLAVSLFKVIVNDYEIIEYFQPYPEDCICLSAEAPFNYFSRNSNNVCGFQGHSAKTVTSKTDLR